jgi:hypothetical protein
MRKILFALLFCLVANSEMVHLPGVNGTAVFLNYSDGTNNYWLLPGWPGSATTCATAATLNFNAIDFASVELDLTAADACALTVSNVVAGGKYLIKVKDASTAIITWPSSFDWGTAGAPTLSASGKFDDIRIQVQQSVSNIHAVAYLGFSH